MWNLSVRRFSRAALVYKYAHEHLSPSAKSSVPSLGIHPSPLYRIPRRHSHTAVSSADSTRTQGAYKMMTHTATGCLEGRYTGIQGPRRTTYTATGCLQWCYIRLQGAFNDVTHGYRVPSRMLHTATGAFNDVTYGYKVHSMMLHTATGCLQ